MVSTLGLVDGGPLGGGVGGQEGVDSSLEIRPLGQERKEEVLVGVDGGIGLDPEVRHRGQLWW